MFVIVQYKRLEHELVQFNNTIERKKFRTMRGIPESKIYIRFVMLTNNSKNRRKSADLRETEIEGDSRKKGRTFM